MMPLIPDINIRELNNELERRHYEMTRTIENQLSTIGLVTMVEKLDAIKASIDQTRTDAFWNAVYTAVVKAFPHVIYDIIEEWQRYRLNDDFTLDIICQHGRARIILRGRGNNGSVDEIISDKSYPWLSSHVAGVIIEYLHTIERTLAQNEADMLDFENEIDASTIVYNDEDDAELYNGTPALELVHHQ